MKKKISGVQCQLYQGVEYKKEATCFSFFFQKNIQERGGPARNRGYIPGHADGAPATATATGRKRPERAFFF